MGRKNFRFIIGIIQLAFAYYLAWMIDFEGLKLMSAVLVLCAFFAGLNISNSIHTK